MRPNVPSFPPGMPISAPPPASPQSPALAAQLIPQDRVAQALYNAAAVLSESKAQILQSLSMLTQTHSACKQTVEHTKMNDSPVLVGDRHISAAQFAERYNLARQEDAAAVAAAIAALQAAAASLPVDALSALAEKVGK